MRVNKGSLVGNGIIGGAVMIGSGNGSTAFLDPQGVTTEVATLTIQGELTISGSGVYNYQVDTTNSSSDEVIANGVTIVSGGRFQLNESSDTQLPLGTVLTAINNTSSLEIRGRFANLPDGAIVSGGSNSYQVNYEGGDGNDLTLTVVQ